ncbi:MAG: ribosomal RNA small subunit methyltransferase A [Gemmatimonadetes bacterium]|nr:ribosomal RNA small subunit methyltransferase A [Gemmatimonadota bacterium]MBT7862010.1 ribosomal RNA small subunit methyltransferase A [Gemmatimonadota bacterium]
MPRPRKRFGQHFLVDQQALEFIAELAATNRGEAAVVEIGPGRGALTRPLLGHLDRLVAIEIDRDLVAHLREDLADPRLHLVEADVLDVDFGQLATDEGVERLVIAGNLPYNISAPVMFKLREHADLVDRAVLTLQKEVADRLISSPGSRQYSLVTVLLAQCAQVEIHRYLPRGAFHPVPKVESAILEIRFEPDRVPVADLALFERIVRSAFSQRRKMLRNSLQSLTPLLQEAGVSLEEVCSQAQVDLTLRAENLSVENYATLTRIIDAAR